MNPRQRRYLNAPSSVLVYKKKFEGWGIFLGTGNKKGSNQFLPKGENFYTFKQSKTYVQKLNIISKKNWADLIKLQKIDPKVPRSPYRVYAKEWKGWGDFFGTGLKRGQNYIHMYKNKLKNKT